MEKATFLRMPCMFQEFRENSEESKRRGQHLFAVCDD